VEIVRFDEEVSIGVSDFGSRFRIGPLTGDDARVRVQVMHVPPGGSIGRHPAGARQLFAVLAGCGWVSGGTGDGRDIGAGYGAVWSSGEEHEVRSPGGLTAVCVEGDFELWALAVTTEIVVSDYDPEWPRWFETVCERVWLAVRDLAVRIDHVGSTSVPDLAAKPIIDLDIVVASPDDVGIVIERLATLGYRWSGDLGVPGREAFRRPADDGLPRHHLYVVVEDNKAHLDHWLLRDLLRGDPTARDRYGALKKRNAELADNDIDVYVAAKAAFVADLLTRARADRGLPPAAYWTPSTRPTEP
jgi:GrpB-like predicted nucleotidyltransferase (UPF0157 family)/mannose-6-phosphate isomerase-like protein (cupin superfamily)